MQPDFCNRFLGNGTANNNQVILQVPRNRVLRSIQLPTAKGTALAREAKTLEPINIVLCVMARLKPGQNRRSRSPEKCAALPLIFFTRVARLYHLESDSSFLISNHIFHFSDWANALTKYRDTACLSSLCDMWRYGPYARRLPCPHCLSTAAR